MAGAVLPNFEPLIRAGINPKTGLPIKFGSGEKSQLKEDTKKFLRLIDEQDAVNRYKWTFPKNLKLTSQEIERMLYYKGQLCLFYDETLDEYILSPYALDGTIDFYGRFNQVHPVPMACGSEDKGDKAINDLFSLRKLKVYYVKPINEEVDKNKATVLLHDYTKQLSQTIIPRATVNDPILDVMAECVPMARTSRLLASGIKAVRVNNENESLNIEAGNRQIENASLTGKPFIPVVGSVDFQELQNSAVTNGEEFMLAMQSLDNLRLSGYGLENGGLYEKKSHILQSESDINGGPIGLVKQDGLTIRKHFAELANFIFGTNEWGCDIADEVKIQEEQMDPYGDEQPEEGGTEDGNE